MKINNKTTIVAICYALSHANIHSIQPDDFEQEFITKMSGIQQQFQDVANKMESTLKNVREHIIYADNPRTAIDTSGLFANNIQNQNTSRYYQQSSSSLSFMNKDKAIKIVEQKDNQKTTYLITVTDKTSDGATQEHSDITADVRELAGYVKKAFQSKPADKILQECIDALQEEQKDRIMNIEATTDGNQTKYTVEIAHKMATNTDANMATKKQSRKNKKLEQRS
ncbi:MAG: hypothetical protein Q8Q60_03600 [Candidatus Chromulinivorax sp.]|nr:hypothetical protein [Candidatus Chromulinivorax sp.]